MANLETEILLYEFKLILFNNHKMGTHFLLKYDKAMPFVMAVHVQT